MTYIDFEPATGALARLVAGIAEDQLDLPTPCPGWTVADLLDHLDILTFTFRRSAEKNPTADQGGQGDASLLTPDWRTRVPVRLAELAAAWNDPAAWQGRTSVAGVEQSGAECVATALDEVVAHSWDLALATGQQFRPDEAAVAGARGFAEAVASGSPDGVPGLFGPQVEVPKEATPLEELLALTGRDPGWRATPR